MGLVVLPCAESSNYFQHLKNLNITKDPPAHDQAPRLMTQIELQAAHRRLHLPGNMTLSFVCVTDRIEMG